MNYDPDDEVFIPGYGWVNQKRGSKIHYVSTEEIDEIEDKDGV